MPIEFHPQRDLPPRELETDHLDEVLMGLLQLFADAAAAADPAHAPIRIETLARGVDVVVRMARSGRAPPPGARFESLQRRATELGWPLAGDGPALELVLPAA
jgi:hypothetical protein